MRRNGCLVIALALAGALLHGGCISKGDTNVRGGATEEEGPGSLCRQYCEKIEESGCNLSPNCEVNCVQNAQICVEAGDFSVDQLLECIIAQPMSCDADGNAQSPQCDDLADEAMACISSPACGGEGDPCSATGDCCDGYDCIDVSGSICLPMCEGNDDCDSDCCVAVTGQDYGVCADAENCEDDTPGTGGEGGDGTDTGGTGGAATGGTGGDDDTGGAATGGTGGAATGGTGGDDDTGGAATGGTGGAATGGTGGDDDTGGAVTGGTGGDDATGGAGGAACLAEGESYNPSVRPRPGEEVVTDCCPGLAPVDGNLIALGDGTCRSRTGGAIYCLPCGDGVCEGAENECNCADDCPPSTGATIEEAALSLAEVACTALTACFPGYIHWAYGDTATCVEREGGYWVYLANLPDSSVTVEVMDSCHALWPELSCDEAAWGDPKECTPPGPRADGEACVAHVQCASGWCEASPYSCGACGPEPAAGSACEQDLDCAFGQWCMPTGTCGVPAGPGEACSEELLCEAGLTCAAGSCVRSQGLGDTCDIDLGLACDWLTDELVCDAGTCIAFAWGAPGEPCGWVDGVWTSCGELTTCTQTGDLWFCSGAPTDGGPCDPAAGAWCQFPAQCVEGVCRGPDDAPSCD